MSGSGTIRPRVEKTLLCSDSIEYLPTASIVPDPNQPRESIPEEHIDRLSRSLVERGRMLVPIRVRFDKALGQRVIVAGHCRWMAAQRAGMETVPVICSKQQLAPLDLLIEQVIDNAVREDLRPVEYARALVHIREESGQGSAALAEKLGLLPSDFTMADALLSLPGEWQSDVDSGLIGKTTAYYLSRLDDPQMRNDLWQQARIGQLTKDQARAAVKSRAAHHNRKSPGGRISMRAGSLSLTYRDESGSLDELLETLDAVRKEIRKAIDQGCDPKTFARQMKARSA
jgi:ParB family chromosome partitioning protein